MDFSDTEKRLTAYHDSMTVVNGQPVVFDMKTTSAVNKRDMAAKTKAMAEAYGMGKVRLDTWEAMFDKKNKDLRTHEELADRSGLSDEQWRWAVAFREVLGVGDQFYEWANGTRKRSLEHHHKELAKHDTAKGRKAAKVVSKMMQLALEGKVAPSKRGVPVTVDQMRTLMGGTVTGRMSRTMMGSPVEILRGVKAAKVIVDDHDHAMDAMIQTLGFFGAKK